ncbi:MAG: leucine-rich repeat domain-containing protein [Treponema sp.]|nr:leucine-rich repeat domain-containing protein [Treponema sp.]
MKTAKRFAMLAGLALALMAVLSFTGCNGKGGSAKAAPESDFEFRLSEDGTFIELTEYKGNAEHLVIPETIQGVPVEVIDGFYQNKKIKSVVIPSSAKVINNSAFLYCESLEKVTLPEGLFCIEHGAFGHTGLTSVTLPKSLEYLRSAFLDCNNLTEINIPDDAAFLVKNATEVAVFLSEEKGWTDEIIAVSGEEIFSGSKINESVALQKKLREIKCITTEALTYYPKAEEKYSRWH